MPAATVTTTVAVAYTASIGVTRRPRWSHRSRATTKIHQATPGFPRRAGWGRVPTGPSSGAPCPYPRRKSRVVQPNELLLKGSGIKAVFSLALLPRRPYMRESSCSVGGGVDSSNHQFPRQTDRGQEHRRSPSDCKCVSAANPHLLRFSQICPKLVTFWPFSLLRRNRRPAAQSQDQTYIFLMCRI